MRTLGDFALGNNTHFLSDSYCIICLHQILLECTRLALCVSDIDSYFVCFNLYEDVILVDRVAWVRQRR